MLTLPIKKKWYDMILSGEKKEEYREVKEYYDSRFMNTFGAIWVGNELLQGENVPEELRKEPIQQIAFRNGYGNDKPTITCLCSLSVGTGRKEWGAEPGEVYYILEIQEVVKEDRTNG